MGEKRELFLQQVPTRESGSDQKGVSRGDGRRGEAPAGPPDISTDPPRFRGADGWFPVERPGRHALSDAGGHPPGNGSSCRPVPPVRCMERHTFALLVFQPKVRKLHTDPDLGALPNLGSLHPLKRSWSRNTAEG